MTSPQVSIPIVTVATIPGTAHHAINGQIEKPWSKPCQRQTVNIYVQYHHLFEDRQFCRVSYFEQNTRLKDTSLDLFINNNMFPIFTREYYSFFFPLAVF